MAQLLFCFLLTFAALGPFASEAAAPASLYNWMFLSVNDFTWSNCDGNWSGNIISLSVSPNPINIPGELTISIVLETTERLTAPTKIILTAKKKILLSWITLPCIDNIGSCTYDNICEVLDTSFPLGEPCPEPLHTYGIPCHCPFEAGVYSLPEATFTLPNVELPSWLTSGDYHVNAVIMADNQKFACANFTFFLGS
ncbi:ganglioside GM2 activator [Xenopus tropicalis]|uniref:Ganglioside GM2 activator n=1 Tax=Xenopus tropicalis TaxID=8364 RepID=A0A6I8SJG0_XENTR|nr:ganglioside GM2 activator [Xenopus tropicalis]|eukprot:XP_012815181.1 PREDICTED: ganglioside GM2 activator-like [Xenopus tropicalis]